MSTSSSCELNKQEVYIQHGSDATWHFQNKLLARQRIGWKPGGTLDAQQLSRQNQESRWKNKLCKSLIILLSMGLNVFWVLKRTVSMR